MCPFVERVRLALELKEIEYQTVQINLEDRTKWHREINNGFVPFIEIPSNDGLILTDSKPIIQFLDKIESKNQIKFFSESPKEYAAQLMDFWFIDDFASNFYVLVNALKLKENKKKDEILKNFRMKILDLENKLNCLEQIDACS